MSHKIENQIIDNNFIFNKNILKHLLEIINDYFVDIYEDIYYLINEYLDYIDKNKYYFKLKYKQIIDGYLNTLIKQLSKLDVAYLCKLYNFISEYDNSKNLDNLINNDKLKIFIKSNQNPKQLYSLCIIINLIIKEILKYCYNNNKKEEYKINDDFIYYKIEYLYDSDIIYSFIDEYFDLLLSKL